MSYSAMCATNIKILHENHQIKNEEAEEIPLYIISKTGCGKHIFSQARANFSERSAKQTPHKNGLMKNSENESVVTYSDMIDRAGFSSKLLNIQEKKRKRNQVSS